jgi:hypothetical protein
MKNLPKSVAELQRENVAFELECIDRMYLNLYVPQLSSAAGVAAYFRGYKGHRFASTKEAAAMSEAFRRQVLEFAQRNATPMIRFEKGTRKDDVMKKRLRRFKGREGVVFIGIAQEKARVPRTIRKRFAQGDGSIPWIDYTTAMVNHYYFYCVDEDFGPFFIKFCSYFPYTGKLCINGHEYLNKQPAKRGIDFEALDNGVLRCADPAAAQRIAEGFNESKIERFFRKWLSKLPHPYPAKERKAGYRYRLSVLQAEFSLTQSWDHPRHGREFFEEVIRENIDLGRPETVQLIFARRMRRSTVRAGRCRTRIVTEGVIPSLHVYYKNTHLKQYHKSCRRGAGLRTETTINNAYDFGVGRLLRNLPKLRTIGFAANRRMLEVEKASHDCRAGARIFESLQSPALVEGQRASAMRFGDPRVQALFTVLLLLCLQLEGFRNRQLRPLLAQMLGLEENNIAPGRVSYELRRLRLHGLIERIERTHRYRLTANGLHTVVFYQRTYARLIRPALSVLPNASCVPNLPLARAFHNLQFEIDAYISLQAA